MIKNILRRVIFSLISLAMIVVVNFFLPRLMPGDPVYSLIGADEEYITQEQYDFYYHKLGLDKPLTEQFGEYLKTLFSGSFGYTYHYQKEVSEVIREKIPATMQLALPSIVISALLALLLGLKAGYKKNKLFDNVVTTGAVAVNAVPTFLMAMLLLVLCAYKWRILPYGGLNSIVTPADPFLAFLDRIKHLILPVTTLVLVSTPSKYLMMRNTTISDEKYVLYAKARGVSDFSVKLKHIFRNICQPFIVLVGMSFGKMLSGSIVVEIIFSIDGMGMLINQAIINRDFAILQGCLFLIAIMVIFANLVTDFVCVLADPRLRYGGTYEK